jgi:hypothetical protein
MCEGGLPTTLQQLGANARALSIEHDDWKHMRLPRPRAWVAGLA